MSMSPYDEYIRPFYARTAMKGNTPADMSNAALLAFIAEFPEFPIRTGNTEFLKNYFSQFFKQE